MRKPRNPPVNKLHKTGLNSPNNSKVWRSIGLVFCRSKINPRGFRVQFHSELTKQRYWTHLHFHTQKNTLKFFWVFFILRNIYESFRLTPNNNVIQKNHGDFFFRQFFFWLFLTIIVKIDKNIWIYVPIYIPIDYFLFSWSQCINTYTITYMWLHIFFLHIHSQIKINRNFTISSVFSELHLRFHSDSLCIT